MKSILQVLLLALAFAGSAKAAEVTAVKNVDLSRYMGVWYEQAHFPLYFQRMCVANTTATYSLRKDGLVDVHNRCEERDGSQADATGVAKTVDGSTSKLKVRFAPAALSFLPFVWGDYWVIALDRDYQWSVVGTPNRKYLWILTRDKKIPQEKFDELVNMAKAQGFDTTRLIRTEQR